jgi:transposase
MVHRVKALVDGVDEFIGIDHHKRCCEVVIKGRDGRVVNRGNIPTSKEALEVLLGEANGQVRLAVFEAGPRYRPMWRWLGELVDQVVVANPGRLKIISQTAYKDDKIDAEKLANFGMLGMVPQAYACTEDAWDSRQLLRQRVALVRMQTALKNRIHALVDLHPDAEPARPEASDVFGKLGMAWLRDVQVPPADRKRLDQLLEVYEFLHGQIARSDAAVRRMVRSDERCQSLTTVPGIGQFFAALIVAEVDRIERFPNAKHFVSYTGLVPGRHKSDKVDRPRRMHKQGSRWLRWALVEAAVPATRANLALKNLYDRICRKKGPKAGPNLAKVAVANKLAQIVYRILVERRGYEER